MRVSPRLTWWSFSTCRAPSAYGEHLSGGGSGEAGHDPIWAQAAQRSSTSNIYAGSGITRGTIVLVPSSLWNSMPSISSSIGSAHGVRLPASSMLRLWVEAGYATGDPHPLLQVTTVDGPDRRTNHRLKSRPCSIVFLGDGPRGGTNRDAWRAGQSLYDVSTKATSTKRNERFESVGALAMAWREASQ